MRDELEGGQRGVVAPAHREPKFNNVEEKGAWFYEFFFFIPLKSSWILIHLRRVARPLS